MSVNTINTGEISTSEFYEARMEAYLRALQYKYPDIDGGEESVLEANKHREQVIRESIEKEKESIR
jgi:hypothetical protein